MNRRSIAATELGAFASGMLDVLFAFTIALERKGLLDRAAIVDTLRQVKDQVEAQEGAATQRSTVAQLMLRALDMPVAGAQARARLRLVD